MCKSKQDLHIELSSCFKTPGLCVMGGGNGAWMAYRDLGDIIGVSLGMNQRCF